MKKLLLITAILSTAACGGDSSSGKTPVESSAQQDQTRIKVAASPAGGLFDTVVSVTLECLDGFYNCQQIHYTLDDSIPDQTSPVYNGALLMSVDNSLQYRAVDSQGNWTPLQRETYIINVDTDGDNIRDSDELNVHFTNPYMKDTDADGYDDFREIVAYNFNGAVDNFRFNPRIADLPNISVDITTLPEIGIKYTTTNSSETTLANTRLISNTEEVNSSKTDTNSWSTETTEKLEIDGFIAGGGAKASAQVGTGIPLGGVGPSAQAFAGFGFVSVDYDKTETQTEGGSVAFTEGQSSANTQTAEAMQSLTSRNDVTSSEGYINLGVSVRNKGVASYTLKSLNLNLFRPGDGKRAQIQPLGAMSLDNNSEVFSALTVAPGSELPRMLFTKQNLPVSTTIDLLRNTRSLITEIGNFEITDVNGVPFPFFQEGIKANTALIIIDSDINSASQSYRIATNFSPLRSSIAADEIFTDLLKFNWQEGVLHWQKEGEPTQYTGLTELNGLSYDINRQGYWIAVKAKYSSTEAPTLTRYDATEGSYSMADIQLSAGDVLHFVYISDEDGDGLGSREEYLYSTNPAQADSDGDGINDLIEISGYQICTAQCDSDNAIQTTVYSNPTSKDSDGDGIEEPELLNDGSLSLPNNEDSDGDMLNDNIDLKPLQFADILPTVTLTDRTSGSERIVDMTLQLPDLSDEVNTQTSDLIYDFILLRQKKSGININFNELSSLANGYYNRNQQVSCDSDNHCYEVLYTQTGLNADNFANSASRNFSYTDLDIIGNGNVHHNYVAMLRPNGESNYRAVESQVISNQLIESTFEISIDKLNFDACNDNDRRFYINTPSFGSQSYYDLRYTCSFGIWLLIDNQVVDSITTNNNATVDFFDYEEYDANLFLINNNREFIVNNPGNGQTDPLKGSISIRNTPSASVPVEVHIQHKSQPWGFRVDNPFYRWKDPDGREELPNSGAVQAYWKMKLELIYQNGSWVLRPMGNNGGMDTDAEPSLSYQGINSITIQGMSAKSWLDNDEPGTTRAGFNAQLGLSIKTTETKIIQ